MIACAIDLKWQTIEPADDAAEICMKKWPKFIGDQRGTFFRRKYDVVEEICVGHYILRRPLTRALIIYQPSFPQARYARQGLSVCRASRSVRSLRSWRQESCARGRGL